MTDRTPPLDGLGDIRADQTPMEAAARRQLAQLRADGKLTDQHIIVEQLVLDLARAIGESAAKGRAAGVALAARELREALELLPHTVNDEFAELAEKMRQANEEANAKSATRKPPAPKRSPAK